MEAEKDAPNEITKSVLKSIHDAQLTNGDSNNLHQEEIISTLGGIDEILSHLFQSNMNFSRNQLQSLHNIMTHPDNNKQTNTIAMNKTIADIKDVKGHEKRLKLEFTFDDDDILLYKIFNNKQTADNIIHILNSNITKIVLAMIVFIMISLKTLSVSTDVFFVYQSFVFLTFSIYFFGWILYSNSKSMKLLLKETEFWFQVFVLPVHSTTHAIIKYVQGYPLHNICTFFVFSITILFLVIVFGATKNKTILSSFSLTLFSQSVLLHFIVMNMIWSLFYRGEFYSHDYVVDDHHQLKATISLFGLGLIRISIMNIFVASTQILAIFLLKQMIPFMIMKSGNYNLIKQYVTIDCSNSSSGSSSSTNEEIQERNNSKHVNNIIKPQSNGLKIQIVNKSINAIESNFND